MKPLPLLADDLIKELDKTYPHRCPSPLDSPAEMWMKAGERRLVDSLLARLNVPMDKLPNVLPPKG